MKGMTITTTAAGRQIDMLVLEGFSLYAMIDSWAARVLDATADLIEPMTDDQVEEAVSAGHPLSALNAMSEVIMQRADDAWGSCGAPGRDPDEAFAEAWAYVKSIARRDAVPVSSQA